MEHARCTKEQREFMKYKMKDEKKLINFIKRKKKTAGNC